MAVNSSMKFGKMLYYATGLIFGCIMLSSACKLKISGYKGKLVSNEVLEKKILKVESMMRETLGRQETMLHKIMGKGHKEKKLPLDMCLEDVSLKKLTGQSSTYRRSRYPSRNGVDGDLHSMIITNSETNPYWWVDLGGAFSVHHVEIWNRPAAGHRFRKADIMVGPTLSKMTACTYYIGPARSGELLILKCSKPTIGRIVKIALRGKEYLQFMEAKVFAYGKTCLDKPKPSHSSLNVTTHSPK
ncbi:fucolectin-like isoform X2 [Mytilus edulis]